MDILDCHTHRLDANAALISVDPRQFDPQPGLWYSVGYHPWDNIGALTAADFDLLERCASHPQVIAIGETGMDSLRGGDLDTQEAIFVRHLKLAHALGKPVVVHNVRCAQRILAARHRSGLDDVPLAIHGMRSNERVARTLLDAGCYLSFGTRFNPAALRSTPLDRLLIETDEAPVTIQEVADAIAATLQLTRQLVSTICATNLQRLLQHPHPIIKQQEQR